MEEPPQAPVEPEEPQALLALELLQPHLLDPWDLGHRW